MISADKRIRNKPQIDLSINDFFDFFNLNKGEPQHSSNRDMMSNRKKILVVDDSKAIVGVINEILRKKYNVRTAYCGEEALDIMSYFVPDLVLLDVVMPGIDGYDVCRKIKSDNKFEDVKVIIISGETQLKNRLEGFEAGADDYITKPVEVMELLAKVKVFLRLKDCEDQLKCMNDNLNKQVSIRSSQLVESEKLAAIGQHTAGIVHNLNNPLQALMGYADLLRMDYPDNERIHSLMKAAETIKEIIMTILISSRKTKKQNIVGIDFNKIVTDQIEIMKVNQVFKNNIEKRLRLQTLPIYKGIYSHFSQSLGNLMKNAVEAMYDSEVRVLEVSTSSDDEMIYICISDTGYGIKEEDMERIFHPFYTTKPLLATNGRPAGTGLGLASTKEMIESYKGKITVESKPGKGSTFRVCLPIEEKS